MFYFVSVIDADCLFVLRPTVLLYCMFFLGSVLTTPTCIMWPIVLCSGCTDDGDDDGLGWNVYNLNYASYIMWVLPASVPVISLQPAPIKLLPGVVCASPCCKYLL